ncbi:P-loop NTPase fold protein [Pseudomonas marginalis]
MSKISFQNEHPSGLDVFPGGSHDKVALAMCEYIADEKNSRVIGLDGEFGSGKSSILTMLQNKLVKRDAKYKVWFFDCEQNYQGSIKSNFIELFTDELIKAVGFDERIKESLRDNRDKALGRHFTYTKNTVSRVSSWALLLVVTLFFSTSSFKELFAISKMKDPIEPWLYFVHIFSLLSPLIVLVVARCKLKGTTVGDQPWSIFHLFKGGSDDTVTEKIKVAKDVTPLDLKRTLDADLKLLKGIHYVVILDNLDRLPKDSLRAVWSDLEIFTWVSEDNNLTVIVPFCSNKVAKYLSADNERTYDSRDFIAKKFPVVFRTPPIITAGWKDGFYTLWDSTYPEDQREISEKCATLLQRHSPMAGKLVTPRLQKRFINDIATTSLTLGSDIDLFCIGAYLLLCKYNDLPVEEVIRVGGFSDAYKTLHPNLDYKDIAATQQVLQAHIGSDLEGGWQIQFLQIHFLTNSKIAMAELIDEPLAMSITEMDSKRFSSLVTAFGFKDAFKRYLSKDGYNSELVQVLGTASSTLSSDEFKLVISTLNGMGKIFQGDIQDNEQEFYSALKTCRLAGLYPGGMNMLKQEIFKKVKQAANSSVDSETVEENQDQLRKYDSLLDSLGLSSDEFTVDNASYFIHVFATLEDLKVVSVDDFKFTKAGIKNIHQHIISLPNSTEIVPVTEFQRELLLETISSSRKSGYDPVVAMTDEDVSSLSNSLITYPNNEAALFGLVLSQNSNAAMIAQVVAQSFEGRTVSQDSAVAILLLIAKDFKNLAKVEKLESIVESRAFKLLFNSSASCSDALISGFEDPVVGGVIAKILAWAITDDAIWRLNHSWIPNDFTRIANALEPYGVDSQKIFEWLNDWQRHFKVNLESIESLDPGFVEALVSSSEEYFPTIKAGVLQHYSSDESGEDSWGAILLSGSPNHRILIDYLSKQEGFHLGSAYRSAIVSVVKKIVTGDLEENARSNGVSNIEILLRSCGQEQKNLLGAELRNLAYSEKSLPEPVVWLFKNFGSVIVDIQPANTSEVGKLMGVLEYLSTHSDESADVLDYLDSRARQIAGYKYSKELLGAMAVSVASLKKLAPKLYRAFARKTDFKSAFKEIFSSEKKKVEEVLDTQGESTSPHDASDVEPLEKAPKG